jgi:hypothetical protein
MADNARANPSTGADAVYDFAADEVGGVLFPRSKLVHGEDGENKGDVAWTNPLPVFLTDRPTVVPEGITPDGNRSRLRVNNKGQLLPADDFVVYGVAARVNEPAILTPTDGYNSIGLQLVGTWAATVTFQSSNDGTTWVNTTAWPTAGGTAPVVSATANGMWLIPAVGRFFRAVITAFTSGQVSCIATLQNQPAFFPASTPSVTIAANSAVNVAQVGGTAATNGVPLIANGATNGASVATLISTASNNLNQLKGTIGRLYLIDILNTNASPRYLKLFNLPSASVTMTSTVPSLNFAIPGTNGKLTIVTDIGINLGGTGIAYAITGGSALLDNTSIGAGDCIANFMYM